MASTTHPSASTDHRSPIQRPTHVRWVFPKPMRRFIGKTHSMGRDESCDSVLEGKETSRRHAELRVDGPIVTIHDLQSRNGVFVNGKKATTNALLQRGDVIRCGEWVGVLVVESEPAIDFHAIDPGWYGGATLTRAVAPALSLGSELPVIVQGETGTGKEGMARALHAHTRSGGPFVAVNCAALPLELAEAELFGYRKGAFTGANNSQPGLFRAAHGGSLFLDEILELPLSLQAKLLRVLQERSVRSLGEVHDTQVDVRIIAATQEPLHKVVEERRFRADLHARLDGFTVELPPLRERREDLVPLWEMFAQEGPSKPTPALSPRFVEALCVYDWPLNVRELNLLCRRLLGMYGQEPTLKRSHLPARMASPDADTAQDEPALLRDSQNPISPGPSKIVHKRTWRKTDDDSEFEALLAALRAHGGSVARAATALGLTRARAYRVLSAHPEFSLDALRD